MAATTDNSKKTRSNQKELTAADLAALEPIIDRLLAGSANAKEVKEVAAYLAKLGHPAVFDQTEQLRLALRLLECHDDSVGLVGKRQKSPRVPEAGLV